jgi:hypothetical protein
MNFEDMAHHTKGASHKFTHFSKHESFGMGGRGFSIILDETLHFFETDYFLLPVEDFGSCVIDYTVHA